MSIETLNFWPVATDKAGAWKPHPSTSTGLEILVANTGITHTGTPDLTKWLELPSGTGAWAYYAQEMAYPFTANVVGATLWVYGSAGVKAGKVEPQEWQVQPHSDPIEAPRFAMLLTNESPAWVGASLDTANVTRLQEMWRIGLHKAPIFTGTGTTVALSPAARIYSIYLEAVVEPVVPVVVTPPRIKVGDLLTAVAATWTSGGVASYRSWDWTDGIAPERHRAIGPEYRVQESDVGHAIELVERARNVAGESADAVSNPTARAISGVVEATPFMRKPVDGLLP